ncbi:MAG: InlB B-repeat-containing protein, partial [Coriobacteriales bacterium]|nr:InlB B-repeat-containing protein [Coriobacteriales bacterium]
GKAYASAATGTLDPTDASVYGGIHTYQNEYDFIPLLPPSSWGFTRYGVSCSLDGDGVVSAQDMAAELAAINGEMYGRYTNGGDPSQFAQVKPYVLNLDLNNLNLDDLTFVSANGKGDKNLREFLEFRAAGLAKDEPTNADYVSRGYEDVLQSAMGTFFLTNDKVIDGGIATAIKGDDALIKALLYGYLSYAADQLKAQGRAKNEAEACAIVLADALSYVYGDTITLSTDGDFLKALGKIVNTHEYTKLVQSLLDKVAAAVPEDKVSLLLFLLTKYQPKSGAKADAQVQIQSDDDLLELVTDEQDSSNGIEVTSDPLELVVDVQSSSEGLSDNLLQDSTEDHELTDEEIRQLAEIVGETLVNLLNENAFSKDSFGGTDEPDIDVVVQADNSQILKQTLANFMKAWETSRDARSTLYTVLSLVSGSMGIDFGSLSDNTRFVDTLGRVLPSLLKKDDGSSFASFAEASDAMLVEGIQAIRPTIVDGAQRAYNDSYANELAGYVDTLAAHPTQLRTILFNTLFGAKGYDFNYHLVTVSTLLNNSEIFVVTHVGEQYLAWMRAVRKVKVAVEEPVIDPTPVATSHSITVTAEPKAGGSASANVSKAKHGTKIALTAKATTGHTFAGWTVVSPNGLTIKNNSFTMPDSAVKVCASFRANKYAVTFNANGGKGSMAKQSFSYGTKQELAANAFTKAGFLFAGWNSKADGSGTTYKNKQEVVNLASKDGAVVTLYAQWNKDATTVPSTKVSARMQSKGWLKAAKGGAVAGKKSGKLRLEALKISLSSSKTTGGIEYRSHLQDKGWENTWVRDGKVSGTKKKSQRLDAVQIRLYGKLKKSFDVYYRVRVQGYGWMGWAKNGQKAGTTGMGRYVGAIQVVLVKKGDKAPAKTFKGVTRSYAKAFVKK